MRNRDELSVMANIAKGSVTVAQAAKALGLNVRQNRCSCPFHNGKDRNMSMKNNAFHCFVCGKSGDLFELVQGVTGMQFIDALRWVNDEFGLKLDIDSPMDKRRLKSAKNRLKRNADDRAFRDRVERMDFDMYCLMGAVLNRLEDQRDQNRPRRYGEEWNDQFCDAVRLIPEVTDAIEYFAIQSTAVRK